MDISTLTMGEIATIEKLAGAGIQTIADQERPKGNALAALALVFKRRNGSPEFTFNDALALSFAEVSALLGLDDNDELATDEQVSEGDLHPFDPTV